MSLTIDLPPEQEQRLRAKAAARGQDAAAFAADVLRAALAEDREEASALDQAIAAMTNRTPEQIVEKRDRLLATSPPPRPLPPGKTLEDVFVGKWPGNETDAQIQAALEDLS